MESEIGNYEGHLTTRPFLCSPASKFKSIFTQPSNHNVCNAPSTVLQLQGFGDSICSPYRWGIHSP